MVPSEPSRSSEPDVTQYARELQEMLRRRSPDAYRDFLRKWRDLHQRGAAAALLTADDDTLRLRLERMILDMPALADLHASARAYLDAHGVSAPTAGAPAQRRTPATGTPAKPARQRARTLRLRRRPRE
jgi:hypothetical protein